MPMIVRQSTMPLVRWPMASHQPITMIQIRLPSSAPKPASRRTMIERPNGHSAYPAIRNAAMPNGIVMISTKQTSPATA
jgi:hypothetical protein